ncbi:Uncharacterised protein [Klebsiella pneumoniae]|nr:Uncharacterised protein [Klebsiella pneumoniae]SYJ46303.1 Uncharacterised protein [Klebsiella pneumoniae]
MAQGFHDSRVIMKVDLWKERGQRLAKDVSIGLKISGKELSLSI